ncbi:unnamed protein product [Closterium sp. NIES-54]
MVEQILTRFCFPFSKAQLTPLVVDHGLTAPPSNKSFECSGRYPELVGCLISFAGCLFFSPTLVSGLALLQSCFADNKSAVLLCEEPRLVGKAKHIQLRYFFLRELQQRGQALIQRVVSDANTADIFTKALPPYILHCDILATVVTDPEFETTAAFALVTELVDSADRSRLNYVASLVSESEPICPPSVGGEPALGSNVLEDRQFELECLAAILPRFASMLLCPEGDPDAIDIPTPRSYAEVVAGEYSSQWQAAMDAEVASWKSTNTYVDKVPPLGANIDDGMWIFKVKRPPGSPPAFKARYVAQGFSQRQGVDYF